MPLKLLSFCSGCGGLDMGIMKTCKSEIVLKCEINKTIQDTIKHHNLTSPLQPERGVPQPLRGSASRCPTAGGGRASARGDPGIKLCTDIKTLDADTLMSKCQLTDADILLCVGGIPCPSFSTMGKRQSFADPRGECMMKFLTLCVELKTKYIVMENVRGLLSSALKHRPMSKRGKDYPPLEDKEKPGTVLKSIVEFLETNQYSVSYQLYDAKFFGTPQSRDRVILMAVHDEPPLPFLEPTHGFEGLPDFKSLGDSIRNLEIMKTHQFIQFPKKRLAFFEQLKEGENWRNLPKDQQEAAMGPGTYKASGGKSGVFRRLSYKKPCPTLTCSPTMHTTALCHPKLLRPLSVEEYKVIQGFPLDYVIKGTVQEQYKQLGNSVPIMLSQAIGRVIQNHKEGKKDQPVYRKCSRYNHEGYYTKPNM